MIRGSICEAFLGAFRVISEGGTDGLFYEMMPAHGEIFCKDEFHKMTENETPQGNRFSYMAYEVQC
jgi:hypothetical protein